MDTYPQLCEVEEPLDLGPRAAAARPAVVPGLEVVSGATARAPLLVPLQSGLSATEHAALRATYGKCSWYGEVTLEVREGGKLRHIRLTLPVRARVEGFEGEVLLGRAGNIPSQRKR